MKTDIKTGGFGGGFTDVGNMRPMCRTAQLVQVRTRERARMAAYEDARPVLQHRTGASNGAYQLTEDSISRMPRWKRWGLYAIFVLTLSGILPMAAAALLTWLCDLVGWWILIPLYIVIGRAVWRVICS